MTDKGEGLVALPDMPALLWNIPHPVQAAVRDYAIAYARANVEAKEAEVALWKSQVHDEIAANLAFREAGGALPDEDMPTFCARLIAERDQNKARAERLEAALDHIARVSMGSRQQTTRTRWIVERAISAINGNDDWKNAARPFGYHDALERLPAQDSGRARGGEGVA